MNKIAEKVNKKSLEGKDFWDEYRNVILEQGIAKAKAEWNVKWVQKFARSVQSVPLRLRRAEHVRAFLSNLENQAKVERWQVEQAAEALRVLYQEFLVLAWAQNWSDLIAAKATSRPVNTPSSPCQRQSLRESFRDKVTSTDVDTLHNPLGMI